MSPDDVTRGFMRNPLPPSRDGKKMLSVWIEAQLYRDLKIISAQRGLTMQILAEQGLGTVRDALRE
jgi:hypothetical protein